MRIQSPVFVGRREQLARLSAWVDEAREGSPRAVVIGGEAGIGKSRLVTELSSLAGGRGLRVLSGAAADYGEGGLPFGAVAEALRPIVSQPLPAAQSGQVGAGGGSPPQHAFEQLLGLLERSAAEQPTLLVLEDLHWADVSTREFLAFLARNLGTMRLLVVGTYRADDVRRDHPLRRYLAELDRAGRIERIELARFGHAELRQQLEAIRGEAIDEELLGQLYERTQGNPFFSEEVLAAQEQGAALPPGLKEILLARLDELSAQTRTVLAAASVAGRADDEFLVAVTGLTQDQVTSSLREAMDHFVLETGSAAAVLGYAFRHALLREAIYDDLLAGERVRLHRRVAQAMAAALEAQQPPGADAQMLAQLAHHWERAGQPAEAFVAAWRAGEAAAGAHAYPEASLHLARAVQLWDHVPQAGALLAAELQRVGSSDPADRATVLQRAAGAAQIAGESRAAELFALAAGDVDPAVEPDRAAVIQLGLHDTLLDAGEAERALARALALLNSVSAPEVRADVLLAAASRHVIAGRLRESIPLIEEGLAAAERASDARLQANAHVTAGGALSFMGRMEEGLEHYATARSVAAAAGLEADAATADKWRGVILDAAARFDEAIAALQASQVVAKRLGWRGLNRHTDAVIAQALHRSGRWAEAEAALARALAPPAAEWGRVVLAYLLVGLGRMEEAQRQLEQTADTVRVSNSSASYGPYYAALAEKQIWAGRLEEALASVDEGLGRVAQMGDLRWVGDLTMLGMRAAADVGEAGRERAAQLMEHLRELARGRLEVGSIFEGEVRAALASAGAELGRSHARSEPAAWAAAAEAWLELGEPYPAAYALYRQAEALVGAGSRPSAREPLGRAFELAGQLGAGPLLGEIESLAKRARLDVGQASAQPAGGLNDYGLTSREREVLGLLARGNSDQQIADELFISPKTASVHVSNVKGKLGVEHRIEAAAVGLRLGLGREPAPPDERAQVRAGRSPSQ